MSSTELCQVANRSTRDASDMVPTCGPECAMQGRGGVRTRASASRRCFVPGRVTPLNIGSGPHARSTRARPQQPYRGARRSESLLRSGMRGHAGDTSSLRRCPSLHTPRCPRSFEVQSMKPASIDPRAGSTTGSRYEGGATPRPRRNVDPRPDWVIQAQMGHVSPAMMRTYSPIRRKALDEAAAALEPSFKLRFPRYKRGPEARALRERREGTHAARHTRQAYVTVHVTVGRSEEGDPRKR